MILLSSRHLGSFLQKEKTIGRPEKAKMIGDKINFRDAFMFRDAEEDFMEHDY